MAATTRYGIYPASFTNGTPWHLNQVDSVDVRFGPNKTDVIPGGNVDRSAVMMVTGDPRISFSTSDVLTALTNCTMTAGYNASAGATIRYQQRADGGTFSGGSTFSLVSATKGFLYPTTLTAQNGDAGGARIDLEFVALYDGTNAALTASVSQAVASPTPAFNSKYFMGPVYANGTQIDGVQSVTIQTGMAYTLAIADGELWARVGSIVTRRPTIQFTMLKVDYYSNFSSLFNNSVPGTIACYFARGVDGGARVSYASASHVKISAATGSWSPDNVSVREDGDAMMSVTVMPTGTLSTSVASAIP